MTNEEAIIEIKDASDSEVRYGDIKNHHDEVIKRVEAFDMAIEALEQQPCDDCISREAVDEYITNLLSGYLYDEERTRLEDLSAFIWELPSVQPCEDCISRQAVHEMLENIPINENDKWFNWLQKACLRLAELPSVQPTRPTGKWETFVEDYNKCSKCGEMGKLYRIYKYCPNCGARMTESEDKDADSN